MGDYPSISGGHSLKDYCVVDINSHPDCASILGWKSYLFRLVLDKQPFNNPILGLLVLVSIVILVVMLSMFGRKVINRDKKVTDI